LGGIYLYANHRGCDGGRVYYDGMSSIAQNENLYAQVNQFDIEDTVTANAVLDLRHSTNYRGKISSLCLQSTIVGDIPSVRFGANLLSEKLVEKLSQPVTKRQRSDVEELARGPPAFLWHYLRRSNAVQWGELLISHAIPFRAATSFPSRVGRTALLLPSWSV